VVTAIAERLAVLLLIQFRDFDFISERVHSSG
jgi:hypothetical protein